MVLWRPFGCEFFALLVDYCPFHAPETTLLVSLRNVCMSFHMDGPAEEKNLIGFDFTGTIISNVWTYWFLFIGLCSDGALGDDSICAGQTSSHSDSKSHLMCLVMRFFLVRRLAQNKIQFRWYNFWTLSGGMMYVSGLWKKVTRKTIKLFEIIFLAT